MGWVPKGDLQNFEFIPVDTTIVEEIERNPKKLAEQGGSLFFMQDWGGSGNFKSLAKLNPEQRLVYIATCQGLSDPEAIAEAVSGVETFQKKFDKLENKGRIAVLAAVGKEEEPPVVPSRGDYISGILKDLQRKGYVSYT